METQFEWREEYKIGVDVIDQEHKRLFRIINKLFTFREEEKDSQWTCQEGIKFFKGHAVKHFEDEEAYMASIHYEGLKQHQRIHRDFRNNILPALEQELERAGYAQEAKFDDVPAGADYAKAVNWAVENGVTAGVAPGQFGPGMVCTRAQIVTFLYSALA